MNGSPVRGELPIRAAAAILCVTVSWIHIQDQGGGFPGNKTPHYVAIGYYALEASGALCAVLLLAGSRVPLYRAEWLLAAGVALGPLLGYALSRGPGLPDYSDDKGNWTEPLGVTSVLVEAALLFLALTGPLVARRGAAAAIRRFEPLGAGER